MAKYSTSLNDISKKKESYLKNSKSVSKGKSGTFRCRNEFLEKRLIRDVINLEYSKKPYFALVG